MKGYGTHDLQEPYLINGLCHIQDIWREGDDDFKEAMRKVKHYLPTFCGSLCSGEIMAPIDGRNHKKNSKILNDER